MSKIPRGVLVPRHEVRTPDERRIQGHHRHERVARADHAWRVPPPRRPDPVDIPEPQAKARVPELVPIRCGRTFRAQFANFRCTATPMADLAHTPATDPRAKCCGDAYPLSFGMFATPDRRLAFEVNDFDETLRAPFGWDPQQPADEPLFLQPNAAQGSVLAPFADVSECQHQDVSECQRQVEGGARGQQMTELATDEFLGWTPDTAAGPQPRLTGPLLPGGPPPAARPGCARCPVCTASSIKGRPVGLCRRAGRSRL